MKIPFTNIQIGGRAQVEALPHNSLGIQGSKIRSVTVRPEEAKMIRDMTDLDSPIDAGHGEANGHMVRSYAAALSDDYNRTSREPTASQLGKLYRLLPCATGPTLAEVHPMGNPSAGHLRTM